MGRRFALVLLVAGLAVGASAQLAEISLMGNGVFFAPVTNNGINFSAIDSAGGMAGLRLHLNTWIAFEADYGYALSRQRYRSELTQTEVGVNSSIQQFLASIVITTPRIGGILQPFVRGGGGLVDFTPRGRPGFAATSQTEGAYNYGAGIDFHFLFVGVRMEYIGEVFKVPNFNNPNFNLDRWTNMALPSLGFILTF